MENHEMSRVLWPDSSPDSSRDKFGASHLFVMNIIILNSEFVNLLKWLWVGSQQNFSFSQLLQVWLKKKEYGGLGLINPDLTRPVIRQGMSQTSLM